MAERSPRWSYTGDSIDIWPSGRNRDLSTFAERPFTLAQVRENSSNGFFSKVYYFAASQLEERDVEFASVEQAFQFCKAAVAYDLWSRTNNESTGSSMFKAREIAWQIFNLENASGVHGGMRIQSLGQQVLFPPSKRHPEGNTAYWDTLSEDILTELIRTSFIVNEDRIEMLLSTGDATITYSQGDETQREMLPKIMTAIRAELQEQHEIQRAALDMGYPIYGSNNAVVSFNETGNPSLGLLQNSDIVVEFGDVLSEINDRKLISLDFDHWEYPLKNGIEIIGTDWEQMGIAKATEAINEVHRRGLFKEDIKLGIIAPDLFLMGLSSSDCTEFSQAFLESVVSEEKQWKTSGGRTYNVVDKDTFLDVTSIHSDGQSGIGEAMVRAAQRMGMPSEVLHKGWSFVDELPDPDSIGLTARKMIDDEKAFRMRFPALAISRRWMPRIEFKMQQALRIERDSALEEEFKRLAASSLQKPVEIAFSESSGNHIRAVRENAREADVTLLLLADLKGKGTSLLTEAAGGHTLSLVMSRNSDNMASLLARMMKDGGYPSKGIALHVTGDRIGRFTNVTQESLNDTILNMFWSLQQDHKVTISSILTGGETGVEMASVVAGQCLGLPVSVRAAHGYSFRDTDGNIISGKGYFKSRYPQRLVLEPCAEYNAKLTEDDRIERGKIDIGSEYWKKLFDINVERRFSIRDVIASVGYGPEHLYEEFRRTVSMARIIGDGDSRKVLGMDNPVFHSAGHAVLALQTFVAYRYARNEGKRILSQKDECLALLDDILKSSPQDIDNHRMKLWDTSKGNIYLNPESSNILFDLSFTDRIIKDMAVASYLFNGNDLQAILATGTRELDSRSNAKQTDVVRKPRLDYEIATQVREDLPKLILKAQEQDRTAHQARLDRIRNDKLLEDGRGTLPENTVRITEDDEGYETVRKAWETGQAIDNGMISIEMSRVYISTSDYQYHESSRDTGCVHQWSFEPNRFYITYDEHRNRFTIEAARWVEEYGFGDYVNIENQEHRNHDCILVRKTDEQDIENIFQALNEEHKASILSPFVPSEEETVVQVKM